MSPERQHWFPKYRDGKKVIVNLHTGEVYSTNPILMASITELLTLALVTSGIKLKDIPPIMDCSKSAVNNYMSRLRRANHTKNGNLYRKAKTLDLINFLALRGLSTRLHNNVKRDKLLRQIDAATEAIKESLFEKTKRKPFGIFPPEELDITREGSWRNALQKHR